MLSIKTHDDIGNMTGTALREISGSAIIDKVMVIRGFQQLLLEGDPNREDCETKIAGGLLGLLEVVKRRRKPELAETLCALLAKVDLERLRHDTGSGPTDHIDPERLLLGKTRTLQSTRGELRHMFHCAPCRTAFYEFSEKAKKADRRRNRAGRSGGNS